MIWLIICNLLLVAWQLFFIDDMGEHFNFYKSWWLKHSRIRRYILLDRSISIDEKKDDFDDFICSRRFSGFFIIFFILNCLLDVVTIFELILFYVPGYLSASDISDSWTLAYVQLGINLVLSIVFAVWTYKYVCLRHLRKLRLFLDFFAPTDKVIYQILSVSEARCSLKAVVKLFRLTDNQLKFFFATFADQGELLDRMSLANKVLNRKDVCQMLSNNEQLSMEMNNLYDAVLSKINQGLLTVKKLEEKQSVANKRIEHLKARQNGDSFVKQFQVIKELHEKQDRA